MKLLNPLITLIRDNLSPLSKMYFTLLKDTKVMFSAFVR